MSLGQTEFIKIASWPPEKLWRYCLRLTQKFGHQATVTHLMKLRREMQIELGIYSKGKPYDMIQKSAVDATENILRWCKGYFMKWAMLEVIKKYPEKAASPVSVKYVARQMWEQFVGRFKY